jgi:hypothetical protein
VARGEAPGQHGVVVVRRPVQSAEQAGHPAPALSINSHGFVADGSLAAADEAFGPFKAMMDRIGRERGWPPMTRHPFEASRTLRGASFLGAPAEVAAV